MQTEKGVTLISVTIYIIVMLIIVAVISVLTSYFYTNIDINSANENLNQQYTKFNSYFIQEVNKKGNELLEIGETENSSGNGIQKYIIFSSGNQYTYIPENQSVYRNRAKIAKGIKQCEFKLDVENYKNVIKVTFDSGDKIRENTYTLNN